MRAFLRRQRRLVGILLGRSYWHQHQVLGQAFVPGRLQGYFNDLTGKAAWAGPLRDGLPFVHVGERQVQHPTVILQWGLGHWDLWLLGGRKDPAHWAAVETTARWLLETQDAHGGWPLWPVLGIKAESAYSAMTQGQAVSLLARVHSVTQDARLLVAAGRAVEAMLRPIDQHGTVRVHAGVAVPEEVPRGDYPAILNGWVFALFGLNDWDLASGSATAPPQADALAAFLPRYDTGRWSLYDLSGRIASPFYHDLHIAQLQALAATFPDRRSFEEHRVRFERYGRKPLLKARALMTKVRQKLRESPEMQVS